MKQFLKFFLASTFGVVAGFLLLIFLLVGIVSGIASKATVDKDLEVKPNSVLKIALNYPIPERASQDPFANFSFSDFEPKKTPGLYEIRKAIKRAKSDDNIKGIYIESATIMAGSATLESIREALLDFKESGKFIFAYEEVLTQRGYHLSSVSDRIFLNPVGLLEFKGYRTELAFFKHALEKLEIEPQIFYAGKYKSATEPFRLDSMSDANREQITFLINDLYGRFIADIAEGRDLSPVLLDSIADNLLVKFPEEAKAYKMVDELAYYDQVQEYLKSELGLDEADELEMVSLRKYAFNKKTDAEKLLEKDKIAVLFAQGGIVDGDGEIDDIGSARYLKAIQKIRNDEDVKALVLRVNSGGGSALASDIILRELEMANERMPVIVSMGDVAASGGYYIACGADTILAEANTITGSIGVFGILPNVQGLMNNKFGITFDKVQTGKYSDIGTLTRPMRADEKEIIQSGVDRVYLTFKERVSEGRGMDISYVDSVGQGRVWTGVQAKELGLVDVLGGLDEAIAIAVHKAGIESYKIKEYPEVKDLREQLMKSLTGEIKLRIFKTLAGEQYEYFAKINALKKWQGVQARMPFEIEIY
ncbi:MAG: signal peptide peptidase SppA [Chitinophagales bacterium]